MHNIIFMIMTFNMKNNINKENKLLFVYFTFLWWEKCSTGSFQAEVKKWIQTDWTEINLK